MKKTKCKTTVIQRNWDHFTTVVGARPNAESKKNAQRRALFELFRDIVLHVQNNPHCHVDSIHIDPPSKRGSVGVVMVDLSKLPQT